MCPELEIPLPDMIDYVGFRVNPIFNPPMIQWLMTPTKNCPWTYQRLVFISIVFSLEGMSKNVEMRLAEEILS